MTQDNGIRCKNCHNCVPSKAAARMGFKNYWTCSEGRFDLKTPSGYMAPTAYAWRGICKPNKGVAAAQKDCPVFQPKEGGDA